MKQSLIRFWLVATISLLCSLSHADSKEARLDHLLDLMGTQSQFEQFPEAIRQALVQSNTQQDNPLSEDLLAIMLDSAEQHLLPSVVFGEIHNSLAKSLETEDIEVMIEWYESDLGQRILQAERNAATTEGALEMLAQAETLTQNTDRVEIAVRFEEALGTTELLLEIQEFAAMGVLASMMTALNPDHNLDLDDYRSQIQTSIQETRAALGQLVILSTVYTYRDIDDASLASFEAFVKLPANKRFINGVKTGLVPGLTKALKAWVADLIPKFKIYQETQSSQPKT